MPMRHLCSTKLYTDYTQLNHKFCAAFRPMIFGPKMHERFNSLKSRNSKFAIWARLLIECVQSYGKLGQINAKYYRGVDQQFIFKNNVARFYVPLSTTVSMDRAAEFTGGSGIVIEFKLYNHYVSGFNCSVVSDFDTEKETLFFGYDTILKINSIYQYNHAHRKWLGCKKYLD
eukprot:394257_1